ncbi:MAG: hypothetical protein IJI45_14855 [Anaerolineaceae bacterium]|jgi:hypothetical protein|nr:hypothetical protein [Anaerolineaceae bacterium]
MAVLIQDDAQLKALEEINQMLEELRDLNLAINSQQPYFIRVNRKRGVVIDDSLSGRIETVLRVQRSRRAKEILAKAAKYRISLDENEKQLLAEGASSTPTEE